MRRLARGYWHPLVLGVMLGSLTLAMPGSAFAHVPAIEPRASSNAARTSGSGSFPADNAHAIDGPDESRAVYGYLAPDQPYDAYTFKVADNVTTTIELIVPVRTAAEGFRPALILMASARGIRLDARDPGVSPRSKFFEPFSLQSFWKGAAIEEVELRPGVRYDLIVTPGASQVRSGPYVIAFSGGERFTAADWARTLRVLPTVWLGTYGGAPVRPLAVVVMVLVALALAGGAAWLATTFLRRRRARRAQHANE